MSARYLILLFLLMLLPCLRSYLLSRPIQSTYTEFGTLSSFLLQFNPQTTISSSCTLQVTFPQALHSTNLYILYSLSNSNNLPLVISSKSLIPIGNTYSFYPNITLPLNTWYKLELFVSNTITIVYGLVSMQIISWNTGSYLIYDSNQALEYYHLEQNILPTVNIVMQLITTPSTIASDTYTIQLHITPGFTTGTILFIFMLSDKDFTTLPGDLTEKLDTNFMFVGSCVGNCNNLFCVMPISCGLVDGNVKLLLPGVTAGVPFSVSLSVRNPGFVDSCGIQAYAVGINNAVYGIGMLPTVLSVSPITISEGGINLHWGIPEETVYTTLGLGVFIDGGINTLDIGFKLSSTTAINTRYTVSIYVGASSVLLNSITSNLPNTNGNMVSSPIVYSYDMPYLMCDNVAAFVDASMRYYVRVRAMFETGNVLNAFGSVSIWIMGDPANILFVPLNRVVGLTTVPYSDFKDITGFHSADGGNIETMVIGQPDNNQGNATSFALNNYLNNGNSFVGIDPELGQQQLLFLMNVPLASMSSPTEPLQHYETVIYGNPNIFKTISPKGLDFSAYSQSTTSYRRDAVTCYINSSTIPTIQIYQCQTYEDYIHGVQSDNTMTISTNYIKFSFVCGNGVVVVCPSANCSESCRILKGQQQLDMYSGVLAIRGVSFIDGYQSPYEANEYGLDFIVCFYHAGVLISATLINAYTIRSTRLSGMKMKIHNNYVNGGAYNVGEQVPTLLEISGVLSNEELDGENVKTLAVMLPWGISVSQFVEGENYGRVGCTYSCNSSVQFLSANDVWPNKQQILVNGIGNLSHSFTLLVPIVITQLVTASIDIGLIAYRTTITLSTLGSTLTPYFVRIYRIRGSSISESLTSPPLTLQPLLTYTTAWNSPTATTWSYNSSYIYQQSLNLDLISPYTISNTIQLSGSILPTLGDPSCTFTISHLTIFTPYSWADVDGKNCSLPFTYNNGQSTEVTVLWCQLLNNAVNKITIWYPLYPGELGVGFPYQTVFAYGYDDENGQLMAFRSETGVKTIIGICDTNTNNGYVLNNNGIQLWKNQIMINQRIKILFGQKFEIRLQIPIEMPTQVISCLGWEMIVKLKLGCVVISCVGNMMILELSAAGVDIVVVTMLELELQVQPLGTPSAILGMAYQYGVSVWLPQTDDSGLPSYQGVNYTPYASQVCTCSALFPISSGVTSSIISLSLVSITALALNFPATIVMQVQFSQAQTALLSTSSIQLAFNNGQLDSRSGCQFIPNSQIWLFQTLLASTLSLTPQSIIPDFTTPLYTLTCTNIIFLTNSLTVQISWLNTLTNTILQQSSILPLITTLPNTNTILGNILHQEYIGAGYEGNWGISLTLPITTMSELVLWIDSDHYYNENNLQCSYSCDINVPIACWNENGMVRMQLGVVTSALVVCLYGWRQDVPGVLRVLGNVVGTGVYFRADLVEAIVPQAVSNAPIVLLGQVLTAVGADYGLKLTYTLPIDYSNNIYIQLDDLFPTNPLHTYSTCTLNTTNISCTAIAANLILLTTTYSHIANTVYQLYAYPLSPTDHPVPDSELISFKMFITDNLITGSTVLYGSHEHVGIGSTILAEQLPQLTKGLYWREEENIAWKFHVVYVGYYGPSIVLVNADNTIPFDEQFTLVAQSLLNSSYIFSTYNVMLGSLGNTIDIASPIALASYCDYLSFVSNSTIYLETPVLPIYVSNEKCSLTSVYSEYTIFNGGATLPIVIDLSLCRPIVPLTITYTLDTTLLFVDLQLSTKQVTTDSPYIIVIVKNVNGNLLTIGNGYWLTIQLSGTYAFAYNAIPMVKLVVIGWSALSVSNTPAVVTSTSSESVVISMSCDEPATIFWAVSKDPTISSLAALDIRARLLRSMSGPVLQYLEPYSWSDNIEGMIIAPSLNSVTNLTINSFQSSSLYTFVYYCLDQNGESSTEQLTIFTTEQSPYMFTKLILTYASSISYNQGNIIACSIAEILPTLYTDVITSTFSNCYNTSTVYYSTNNITYCDQYTQEGCMIFLYIDSHTIPMINIQPTLSKLLNHPRYEQEPYHNVITYIVGLCRLQLSNNYVPVVNSVDCNAGLYELNCVFDVGVAGSYLIVAYFMGVFDASSMSIPATYLIKQGNFSNMAEFDNVTMVYGSDNITLVFGNLKSGINYSLFYFSTVDDPRLSSRASRVQYLNVKTLVNVDYYLDEIRRLVGLVMFVIIWLS